MDKTKQTETEGNKMRLPTMIFTLGTLEVYSESSIRNIYASHTYNHDNVFWRDQASPQGYGPFNSVFECMEHYKYIQNLFKGGVDPQDNKPMAKVIAVDFRLRRRMK